LKAHDPEALAAALDALSEAAQAARDCYLMGDDQEGRTAFALAISALSKAAHQIHLFQSTQRDPSRSNPTQHYDKK
jgi:hypothetical protein